MITKRETWAAVLAGALLSLPLAYLAAKVFVSLAGADGLVWWL